MKPAAASIIIEPARDDSLKCDGGWGCPDTVVLLTRRTPWSPILAWCQYHAISMGFRGMRPC